MIEQELQEFELSISQHRLLTLVAQDPSIGIKPETLKFPDPLLPQV